MRTCLGRAGLLRSRNLFAAQVIAGLLLIPGLASAGFNLQALAVSPPTTSKAE
jgi:hypothetical protein